MERRRVLLCMFSAELTFMRMNCFMTFLSFADRLDILCEEGYVSGKEAYAALDVVYGALGYEDATDKNDWRTGTLHSYDSPFKHSCIGAGMCLGTYTHAETQLFHFKKHALKNICCLARAHTQRRERSA